MKIQTELKLDAAHKLPNYEGKCGFLHGHTWKIIITIDSDVLDEHEFIVDFTKIKEVVMQYDHDFLNKPQRNQVPIDNPTAENLSVFFARQIKELGQFGSINRFNFVTVKVYESDVSFAEFTL